MNDKGGVLGRKLELVLYDDGSDSGTAVRLYEKLITRDEVDLVLRKDGIARHKGTIQLSGSEESRDAGQT